MAAHESEQRSNVIDLVAAMQARGLDNNHGPKASPSRRHPRRAEPAIFRVRVELEQTQVWRVVDIRSDITLDVLHDVVQVCMGWTNSHLHMFAKGPGMHHPESENYLMEDPDGDNETHGVPEVEVRLDEVLCKRHDRLFYWYDFGDSWDHFLTLEAILPMPAGAPAARCVDGARACPPEDCGSVPGYERLCEVFADPSDPEAAELMTWAGDWDPDRFDVADTNHALDSWSRLPQGLATLADPGYGLPPRLAELVRRVNGVAAYEVPELIDAAGIDSEPEVAPEVVASMVTQYHWLLDRVGAEGLTLTSAGYLKPDDVFACATALGWDQRWIGKLNREVQTAPVHTLRESAQKLGLIRKLRGRLVQTANGKKVAGDPTALWRYLASKVPFGDDCERDAGLIALLLVAAGQDPDSATLHEMLVSLGWSYGRGRPIDASGASRAARPTLAVLRRLGVLPDIFADRTAAREPAGGLAFVRTALRT